MSTSITPTNRPSKTWTLDTLEKYALSRADEIGNFGRKTLEQTWLLGEAFSFIRDIKKEEGQWMDWMKTQTISLSTVTNAIKVFERVTFDELKKFNGMTASDLKVALDIIKMPPASRRRKEEKPTPNSPEVATDASTDDDTQEATDATTGDTPEKAAVRKVTITGPSRNGDQKTAEPEVGVALTASEVLGKAYNFLIQAENIGITPACKDILATLSAKLSDLAATIVA